MACEHDRRELINEVIKRGVSPNELKDVTSFSAFS